MSYEFRSAHPVLRWLPTKLAEWIGANHSEELLLPDKNLNEDKWTTSELNNILLNKVVRGPYGHLLTFAGIKWECYLFDGRPKARCYPFNIAGHRFRDKNPQVAPTYCIQCCTRYHIRCRIQYKTLYHISLDMTYSIFLVCYLNKTCPKDQSRKVCLDIFYIPSFWTEGMTAGRAL
jgi:hypothetical protein